MISKRLFDFTVTSCRHRDTRTHHHHHHQLSPTHHGLTDRHQTHFCSTVKLQVAIDFAQPLKSMRLNTRVNAVLVAGLSLLLGLSDVVASADQSVQLEAEVRAIPVDDVPSPEIGRAHV